MPEANGGAVPKLVDSLTGRRSVVMGLAVAVAQTIALAVAAYLTGSVAMRTQTVTNVADVAVGAFLLLGLLSSNRVADDEHPLGYGRERFFWSFVAAVGILVGGAGAAFAETVEALLHPGHAEFYVVGYAVLAAVVGLDTVALVTGLRPLLRRSRERGVPITRYLWKGTDPAVTTVVLGSAAGLLGGVVAAAGLAAREITDQPVADAVASGLIGLVLLATSATLLHANRELLTGRGVSPETLERMRVLVARRPGVLAVPDIFAIVVGPSTLIVNGDIVFDDALDVPQVEAAIVDAGAALRASWPAVTYVYLNPVAAMRSRRGDAALRNPYDDDGVVARSARALSA